MRLFLMSHRPAVGFWVGLVFLSLNLTSNRVSAELLSQSRQVTGETEIVIVQDADNDQDDEMTAMKRQRLYLTTVKKLAVANQLALEIDHIDSVVELDESQKKKFRVGAKAVAKKHTSLWVQQMEQEGMWEFAIEWEPTQLGTDLDLAKITIDDVEPSALQWVSEDATMDIAVSAPTNSKLWLKIQNSILSKNQIAKLNKSKQDEDRNQLDAIVRFLMHGYSKQLRLNAEQRKGLEKLIRDELAKHPVRDSMAFLSLNVSHLASIPDEKFTNVLTKNQLRRWQTLMAPYGVEGMMFMGEFDIQLENIEAEDVEDADQ